jgi:hypothetical protein
VRKGMGVGMGVEHPPKNLSKTPKKATSKESASSSRSLGIKCNKCGTTKRPTRRRQMDNTFLNGTMLLQTQAEQQTPNELHYYTPNFRSFGHHNSELRTARHAEDWEKVSSHDEDEAVGTAPSWAETEGSRTRVRRRAGHMHSHAAQPDQRPCSG